MEQTDRELLELAAKAVGAELHFSTGGGNSPSPWLHTPTRDFYWNPIKDYADAIRLADALDIEVERRTGGHTAAGNAALAEWPCEPDGGNQVAATCRAIVRAAGELSKAMP